MSKRGSELFLNFFVRVIVGITLIFFVNQFLIEKNIESNVGINPVTMVASGTLGVPGVALLYGISFYHSGFGNM